MLPSRYAPDGKEKGRLLLPVHTGQRIRPLPRSDGYGGRAGRGLYEILSKQARAILNVADLSNAGRLDVQLAERTEYNKRIANYLGQK